MNEERMIEYVGSNKELIAVYFQDAHRFADLENFISEEGKRKRVAQIDEILNNISSLEAEKETLTK
jgi:hypothetical protein